MIRQQKMRSKNYDNQVESFTPLQPQQMVRVAVVEGIKPEYKERDAYRKFLTLLVDLPEKRINQLFSLLEVERPTEKQKSFLDDIISEVAYDGRHWKPLNYNFLKENGVVIEQNGNVKNLAKSLNEIRENKVIFVPNVGGTALEPKDEPEYLKHVDWRNKLVINGPDVVRRFGQDKGIALSGKYLKNGYLPVADFRLLESNGFYFNEALKTLINGVLKEPEYKDRMITELVIKRRDGTELVLHPHDFVEAAEFYVYCLRYKKEVIETLGNKITGLGTKYPEVVLEVPKRRPEISAAGEMKSYNNVEYHYLPDPLGGGKYPLDWMSTQVSCDCPHALNLRNFEMRKGIMTRIAETMDTHANIGFLAWLDVRQISPEDAVNNMSPIPTLECSIFVDKARYNIVQEFRDKNGRLTRTYVGEVGIEKIINEAAKLPEWTFERMFNPHEKVGNKLLRPMYV
jgi:hypothetical protein